MNVRHEGSRIVLVAPPSSDNSMEPAQIWKIESRSAENQEFRMNAVVTSKGRITLPADIRREFGIKQGAELVFFKCMDGSLGVRIRRPRPGAGRGMFKADRPLTNEEIDEAIGQELEARYRRTFC